MSAPARARVVALLLALVTVAVTAAVASSGSIAGAERSVARRLYDLPGILTPVLEVVMQSGTRLTVVAAAALALGARRGRLAAGLLVGGMAAWAASTGLKEIVGRDRPVEALLARAPREVAEGFGYPSSHTAIATALVVIILLCTRRSPRVSALLLLIPLATATARVHLGVHWPLDVVGGAAVGAAAALVVASVLGSPQRRQKSEMAPQPSSSSPPSGGGGDGSLSG